MLDGFLASPAPATPRPRPALTGNARAAAQRVGSVIAALRDTAASTRPLTGLFDAIVDRTGYGATFDRTEEEDLDRWANVLELRSELEKLGDEPASRDARAQYLERVALVADVDSLDADERGRVTLITLHSAKGLEFPVVFVAGVEEGLLADQPRRRERAPQPGGAGRGAPALLCRHDPRRAAALSHLRQLARHLRPVRLFRSLPVPRVDPRPSPAQAWPPRRACGPAPRPACASGQGGSGSPRSARQESRPSSTHAGQTGLPPKFGEGTVHRRPRSVTATRKSPSRSCATAPSACWPVSPPWT